VSAPLLDVDGAVVEYPQGRRAAPLRALGGVSLQVGRGETLGLVGESGSGKSTLGNAVLGLVGLAAGTIAFDGEDITHADRARRRALTAHLQVVLQDPYSSLNPARTIGQTLVEPFLAHRGRRGDDPAARIADMLRRVGLDAGAAGRYPRQFSGGQLQRIAIARALMLNPKLVICDEAVSALDLSIQAQILNLLRDLQDELGVSFLFISHDLEVVRHISHRIAVLRRGELVEIGPVEEIRRHPRHEYTRALLGAVPLPDPTAQRARRAARRSTAAALADQDEPAGGREGHRRASGALDPRAI
jgi:ABC-type oligopeptide transport system ATPase subunit